MDNPRVSCVSIVIWDPVSFWPCLCWASHIRLPEMGATLTSVEQPAFAGGGGQVGGLDVFPKGPMVPDYK